mgnify:CR=1 FL=1
MAIVDGSNTNTGYFLLSVEAFEDGTYTDWNNSKILDYIYSPSEIYLKLQTEYGSSIDIETIRLYGSFPTSINSIEKVGDINGFLTRLHLSITTDGVNLGSLDYSDLNYDLKDLAKSGQSVDTYKDIFKGNDSITGTKEGDTLHTLGGNDLIKGGAGFDVIDGGSGIDTAIYTGKFDDYHFGRSTNSLIIGDLRPATGTNDGTDTLSNIEYVQFSDQTVDEAKVDVVKTYSGNFRDYKFYNKGNGSYEIKNSSTGTTDDITGYPSLQFTGEATTSSFKDISAIIDIKGTFDQVTGKETASGGIFRLYNAAFARFPDASGLRYWIDKFSSGVDDERAVASSFLVSDEFKERYGDNVSNAKYVETLYVNVLGRDYDQEGYNYWLGNLNNGTETRYELLLGFAESAENKTLFTEMTGFG